MKGYLFPLWSLIHKIREISGSIYSKITEGHSFREKLFRAYLSRKTLPLFQGFGLVVVFVSATVGIASTNVFTEREIELVLQWTWGTVLAFAPLILIVTISRFVQRWFNWVYMVWFAGFCVGSGYFLGQIQGANFSVMYFLYLLPILSVVSTGDFWFRAVTALMSLLSIGGIYYATNLAVTQLIMTGIIMLASVVFSVILGHFFFFKLSRETFFKQRNITIPEDSSDDRFFRYDEGSNALMAVVTDTTDGKTEIIGLLGDRSSGGCTGIFHRNQFPGSVDGTVLIKTESMDSVRSQVVWEKEVGKRYLKVGFEYRKN